MLSFSSSRIIKWCKITKDNQLSWISAVKISTSNKNSPIKMSNLHLAIDLQSVNLNWHVHGSQRNEKKNTTTQFLFACLAKSEMSPKYDWSLKDSKKLFTVSDRTKICKILISDKGNRFYPTPTHSLFYFAWVVASIRTRLNYEVK